MYQLSVPVLSKRRKDEKRVITTLIMITSSSMCPVHSVPFLFIPITNDECETTHSKYPNPLVSKKNMPCLQTKERPLSLIPPTN